MRVARLQCPRQLSWNHTYPQTGRSCCTQNACIEVSSKCIELENEAVGFPEVLQTSTQETHVPRHDASCQPACVVAPHVRVLRLVVVKGDELSFAQLVFAHEDHLNNMRKKLGLSVNAATCVTVDLRCARDALRPMVTPPR